MTAAVTIPADLAADVAAHPDRYRTAAPDGAEVLVLSCATRGLPHRGTVRVRSGTDPLRRGEPFMLAAGCAPDAWALVGSVDGGPRPAVGDRVLVLECHPEVTAPEATGSVGTVVVALYGPGYVGVDVNGVPCLASRWALLPDPPEPADDWEYEPEPDSRSQPFNHRMCGTRHTVAQGCPLPPAADVVRTGGAQLADGTPVCGATLVPLTPPVLQCTYPAGHGPIVDREGRTWDHGVQDTHTLWREGESAFSDPWAGRPPPAAAAEPLPSIEDAGRAQDWCPTCESTDRAVNLVDEGDGLPCGDPMGWHAVSRPDPVAWQLAVILGDVDPDDEPHPVNADVDELLDRVAADLDAAKAGVDGWKRVAESHRTALEWIRDTADLGHAANVDGIADHARRALGEA